MGKNKSFIFLTTLLSVALFLPISAQALTCSSQTQGTFNCFGSTYVCGNSCLTDAQAAAKAATCVTGGTTLDCNTCSCTGVVSALVPWSNITTPFPAACPAGQFVTAVGSILTCSTPAASSEIIGNEVTNATNSTLTRSGAGTALDPWTLALNLNNANTWTANVTVQKDGPVINLSDTINSGSNPELQLTDNSSHWGIYNSFTDNTKELRFWYGGNDQVAWGVNGTLNKGSIPWARLSGTPSPCAAGQYLQYNGTSLICAATSVTEADGIIGNEVVNSTNSTLVRSGSGTAVAPYTLALNLANANTWTANQIFDAAAFGNYSIDPSGIKLTTPSLYSNVIQVGIGSANMGAGSVNSQSLCIKGVCKLVWDGSLPPSGTAGGDLAGTYPNPTIAQKGATNGQVLNWNGTSWAPTTPVGLPTGTSGQTLRSNGTNWLANSVIYNDGTNVGIGTATVGAKTEKLKVLGGVDITDWLDAVNAVTAGYVHAIQSIGVNYIVSQLSVGYAKDTPTAAKLAVNGNVDIRTNTSTPMYITGYETIGKGVSQVIENTNTALVANYAGILLKVNGDKYGEIYGGTIGDNPGWALVNGLNISPGTKDKDIGFRVGDSLIDANPVIAMVIKSTGNVGIGVNDPGAYKLNVGGNIISSGTICDKNGCIGGGGAGSINGTLNYVSKFTPDGTKIGNSQIIDNGTNVGIGGTDATLKLYINGSFGAKNTASTMWLNGSSIFDTGASTLRLRPGGVGGNIDFQNALGSTVMYTDGTNSRVGIGTTAPATKLDVVGTVKMTGFQLGATATAGQVLTANTSGVGTWQNPAAESDPQVGTITTNYVPKWNSTALVTGLIYDNGTSIGIGTAAPVAAAKLEVAGQVKITGGSPGVNKVLTSDAAGLATWQTPATAVESDPQVGTITTNYLSKWDGSALITSNIFDNGTKLGIGTVTPGAKLEISNSNSFAPASNNLSGLMIGGSYGGGLIFKDSAFAGIWTNDYGQTLVFGTNGTSGGFGSTYGQMVLKNGSIGIGVAAPGAKLDVAGDVKISGALSVGASGKTAVNSDGSLKMDLLDPNDWDLATAKGGITLAAKGAITCTQVCQSHNLACGDIVTSVVDNVTCLGDSDVNSDGFKNAADVQIVTNCTIDKYVNNCNVCSAASNYCSVTYNGKTKSLDLNGDKLVNDVDYKLAINGSLGSCTSATIANPCDYTGGIRTCYCN